MPPDTPTIEETTRRNLKPTTAAATERPALGSQPYVPNICVVAVLRMRTAPSTRVEMVDWMTSPMSSSNHLLPQLRGLPGMTHRQAKKTPTTSSISAPMRDARQLKASMITSAAKMMMEIREGRTTITRPIGVWP